jgi:glycosyltransferase involved in cell wall biosynthesis
MSNYDLSVIIPARNEMFLKRTIEDVLNKKQGKTEVIVILDGYWPDESIEDHKDLTIVHHTVSIGQRQACNEGARLSEAKFIMKLDAHCIMDEGFDVKLMADCEYDWTVVPRMYNLHAFDMVCKDCGRRNSQGKVICQDENCRSENLEMEVIWRKRKNASDFMWFDTTLKFRYFDRNALESYLIDGDIRKTKQYYSHKVRPEQSEPDIADQMTCLGACWFLHRERYWELGGMDEGHGSWGQMGVELACKSWLSGGRQVVNKKTWFAHLFRTQETFKFPYPLSQQETDYAREYSRDLWLNDKWPGAKRPLSWLIDHFSPLPGWDKKSVISEPKESVTSKNKGIVYYTDNRASERVLMASRNQLLYVSNGFPIVSVSLLPIEFGDVNIVVDGERGQLTMFKQILEGIINIQCDYVFLCEHDMLYHPSHFEFVPPKDDVYYYNVNTWKVDEGSGHALFYITQQTSGLVANRDLLGEHYSRRVERVENEGWERSIGYEPGTHHLPRGIDNYNAESFKSTFPNIDIRHKHMGTDRGMF